MNNFISDFLKSKLIIGFAAFGAVFSLVLGLISRAHPLTLLSRALIAAFIMGVMGAFIHFFLKKNLSEEDYNSIFNPDAVTSEPPPAPSAGSRIDVTDNSELAPEDIYSSSGSQPVADTAPVLKRESVSGDAGGFQDMSFGSAPPHNPSDENLNPVQYQDESQLAEKAAAAENRREDMNAIRNAAAQSHTSGKGDVKVKIGNKVINTDASIIAKSIKTILHRDS